MRISARLSDCLRFLFLKYCQIVLKCIHGTVWDALSSLEKFDIQFMSNGMNNSENTTVLQDSLIPFLRRFQRKKLIFQQDNASSTRMVKQKYFSNKKS